MNVVVDTNIAFSAILNSNGKIGDLLFNSNDLFKFYSSVYLKDEIDRHWQKLISISKLTEDQLKISCQKVYERIRFINDELIPSQIWETSFEIVSDIDEDDIQFVAMALFCGATIWSGDKRLIRGLNNKNFSQIADTDQLLAMRQKELKY